MKNDKQHYKLLKTAFAAAKSEKQMSAEQFREAVVEWGFPRLSQCSDADLRAIISVLRRWYVATGLPFKCTQEQVDYMQRLWEVKSNAKTKDSLDNYLSKHFHVGIARTMSVETCGKVIQSLIKWN